MDKKQDNNIITFNDVSLRNTMKDQVGNSNDNKHIRRPKGRVQVFSTDEKGNKKLIEDTSNLIVYRGRNWIMQKIFGVDLDASRSWADYEFGLFALGSGGVNTGAPTEPLSPSLVDYELGEHEEAGGTSTYYTIGGKQYLPIDTGYPKYMHDPDINDTYFEAGQDLEDPVEGGTYPMDSFLVAKLQITVPSDQYNGTGYIDLSEAGLFVTDNATSPGSATDAQLFARVCFASRRKTSSSGDITFVWYLFF